MYVYLQAYEPNATDATTIEPLVAYVSFFQRNVKVMETPMIKVTEGIDPKTLESLAESLVRMKANLADPMRDNKKTG